MPYQAEISRVNPSCFLFLIDQSGSMADPIVGTDPGKKKCDAVADAINRLIQNLIIKCYKGGEEPRHYFDIGVIGYGGSVKPAFGGTLAGRDLIPIPEIATNPARIEERTKKVDDGAGGLVEQNIKFPIWLDPVANGGTPMCEALGLAHRILTKWIAQHPSSFPPVVIHITDGESTDGDPSEAMSSIKSLSTSDGNVLLFNLHLSSNPYAQPIIFPDSPAELPDQYAQTLFNGASHLTPFMIGVAKEHGLTLSEGAKGFVLNADLTLIIQALDIGTRPSNLR